jgi:coatomer protein complex subunit gamma
VCLPVFSNVGPHTPAPSRYIRFIFNRVILENAAVRAAAVTTLGTFATRVPDLRPSIIALLRRSLADEDDEVRDRAAILLQTLTSFSEDSELKFVMDEPMPMSFAQLERSVRAYVSHPAYSSAGAQRVSFATLPIVEDAYVPPTKPAPGKKKAGGAAEPAETSSEAAVTVDPAAAVYALPQFAKLGRAFRTCPEIHLTETEMEYVVGCIKHVFPEHVVLQFTILNTIDDQQLRDVKVNVEVGDPDVYTVESVVPAQVARYGEAANCFVCLKRAAEGGFGSVTMSCELSFKMVQVDPVTGEVRRNSSVQTFTSIVPRNVLSNTCYWPSGARFPAFGSVQRNAALINILSLVLTQAEGSSKAFEEDFPLEDLEISTNDFMAKVSLGDFRRNWDTLGADGEVLEKFALQVNGCAPHYAPCVVQGRPRCACFMNGPVVGVNPVVASANANRVVCSSILKRHPKLHLPVLITLCSLSLPRPLQFKKKEDAVAAVIDFLGMQAVDGTGTVPPSDEIKKPHTLHLAGVFVGNVQVRYAVAWRALCVCCGVLYSVYNVVLGASVLFAMV